MDEFYWVDDASSPPNDLANDLMLPGFCAEIPGEFPWSVPDNIEIDPGPGTRASQD